jgi:hypothetical protein
VISNHKNSTGCALARISERPAYTQLRQHTGDIDQNHRNDTLTDP